MLSPDRGEASCAQTAERLTGAPGKHKPNVPVEPQHAMTPTSKPCWVKSVRSRHAWVPTSNGSKPKPPAKRGT